MKKTILIDTKEVELEANALTPYLYKAEFGEDVIYKMNEIGKNALKHKDSTMDIDIEFFCKFLWLLAKTARKHNGQEIEPLEDWLCQFEMLSIYGAIREVVEMWVELNKTLSTPAKK